MPAQYEHIRDSYLKAGKPLAVAKKLAAMTFNAHRKMGVAPVGPHSDEKMTPPVYKFKFRKPNER